jgi:GAF domain/ANTAR domain
MLGVAEAVRVVPEQDNNHRVDRVWRLVTDRARADVDGADVDGAGKDGAGKDGAAVSVDHVCEAAVTAGSVDGAALSLVTRMDRRSLGHASDEVARLLDDQQFALGEGPCVEGWRSGGLVLADDLTSVDSMKRWPVFTPEALGAGAQAMFAFPLQMGAIRLGTLGLYRARPGGLGSEQLADLLTLCSATVTLLLTALGSGTSGAAPNGGPPAWLPGGPGGDKIEVYQATGMVAVQLGVSLEDAFAALRARAYAQGIPLADIARQVVDRRLRFGPQEPQEMD